MAGLPSSNLKTKIIKSISTINVKGLQDNAKRKKLSLEINLNKREILFLQETHSTKGCKSFWKKDFKMSHSFYSHGTSAARGVAIFLNLKESFEIIKIHGLDTYTDLQGRLIGICIKYKNKRIGLVNCYAPNVNNSRHVRDEYMLYLDSLDHLLDEMAGLCDCMIIGGDFNLILDAN